MTEVRFIQSFGSHQRGSVTDLPEVVAHKLVKVGVAELASTPETKVEPTTQYVADKVVRTRAVRKAPDSVQ